MDEAVICRADACCSVRWARSLLPGRDLRAGGCHLLRIAAHFHDDAAQLLLHGAQRPQQLAQFVVPAARYGIGQMALGHLLGQLDRAAQRCHHGTGDEPANGHAGPRPPPAISTRLSSVACLPLL